MNNITVLGLTTASSGTHFDGNEITITSGIEVSQHKVSDSSLNITFLAPLKLGGNVTITGANRYIINLINLNLNGYMLTNNEVDANFVFLGIVSGNGNIVANRSIYIDSGQRNGGLANT